MNRLNKFIKSFLVASLSLAFMMPNAAITANAATTEVSKYSVTASDYTRPSNVLVETGTKDELFTIYGGYKIKNVKSNSSNLKVYKQTYSRISTSTESNSAQKNVDGSSKLYLYGYAKKSGTYKVSYDITDVNGVKVMPTQTVTVVAKDDVSPFKKITFAGTSLWDDSNSRFYQNGADNTVYTNKTKGKLIVKPASGYKIKKIEVGTYNALDTTSTESTYYTYTTTTNKDNGTKYTNAYGTTSTYHNYDEYGNTTNGTMTYKKVKSGKKITLGTVPFTKESSSSSSLFNNSNYSSSTLLLPATIVRVTYVDKTTKKTFQFTKTIYCTK